MEGEAVAQQERKERKKKKKEIKVLEKIRKYAVILQFLVIHDITSFSNI